MLKQYIKGVLSSVGIFALAVAFVLPQANAASSYTIDPWIYNPGNVCPGIEATPTTNGVHLTKPCPTPTNAASGAQIQGVAGLSTTGLTLGFRVDGSCGAGAPRFNVNLLDGQTIFLGCIHGDNVLGNVTFTAGNTYGGVLFPTGGTVTSIELVQDEQGDTTLSNITVNGQTVTASQAAMKELCKNGGWETMHHAEHHSFKNQGQCVSHFARMR